ncbi:MAG: hypothetical protein KGL04_07060, partial [Elusimicrobia bacterium]|nr:hypothetical protein [Elusimicrobiota bacterium]
MGTLKNTKNLALLAIVAQGLKSLKEKVVFVGGAIIDLHLDPAAPESRPTDDVDCVEVIQKPIVRWPIIFIESLSRRESLFDRR